MANKICLQKINENKGLAYLNVKIFFLVLH
jgi:hypothetical protein